MLKNKKSMVLSEAMTLVLAGVIIFGSVFVFWNRAYAAFFSGKDDGSMGNYEGKLIPKVNDMLSNNKKVDYRIIDGYFLDTSKWILVGFKKGIKSEHTIPMQSGVSITKPSSCGDKACICLFNAGDEVKLLRGDAAKPCEVLDKAAYLIKDIYLSNYGEDTQEGALFYLDSAPDIFKKMQYRYLILASTLGMPKSVLGSSSSSVSLYIEKYTNQNNEIVVYFSPVNDYTRSKIDERKKYIDMQNNI